jgi:hypothetical protein
VGFRICTGQQKWPEVGLSEFLATAEQVRSSSWDLLLPPQAPWPRRGKARVYLEPDNTSGTGKRKAHWSLMPLSGEPQASPQVKRLMHSQMVKTRAVTKVSSFPLRLARSLKRGKQLGVIR